LGHLPLRNPIVDSMRIAFPRAVKSPSRSFQMNVAFWQQSCPTGIETAESCGRLNSPVSMPIITNARAAGRIVPPTAGDPRSEPVTGKWNRSMTIRGCYQTPQAIGLKT
jgi:hypothetical protein